MNGKIPLLVNNIEDKSWVLFIHVSSTVPNNSLDTVALN